MKITRHFVLHTGIGLSFFFMFAFFTFIVREDLLRAFDFDTTHRLQNITPLRIDPFFSLLSVVGRFEFTLGFLLLILFLCRKIFFGIITFGLFGFGHVLELIGKTLLEQPGPPRMFLRSHYSDFPGLHVFTQSSYPSGHSMRMIILAVLTIYILWMSKKLHIPIKIVIIGAIILLTILVLYSRVTLGEHWSTDVIGGGLLGLSIGFFSTAWYNRPPTKKIT